MKGWLASAVSLLLCSMALATEPFDWEWRAADEGVTVSVRMEGGVYLAADAVKLSALLPGGKIVSPTTIPPSVRQNGKALFKDAEMEWRFSSATLTFPLKLELYYQGCRNSGNGAALCFMPKRLAAEIKERSGSGIFEEAPAEEDSSTEILRTLDAFNISRSAVGYQGSDAFNAFLKGEPESSFAGKSFLAMALLALLGGLALNLTPCVLPLIPVNLAIIGAGTEEPDKHKATIRGLVYGAGIALTYGALGLAAAIGGATFGAINSAWWLNVGAGIIFAALALAMFDIFELDLSRYSAKIKVPSSAKLLGVFVLGAFSALLAGACVAPVVIAVLIHSAGLFAEGSKAGLLLPFILGLGMALPWPLAAAGMSLLPKPGAWMLKVKQGLGILIALLAAYYLWTGYSLLLMKLAPSSEDSTPSVQVEKLTAALKASKADGRPVFIDFWASWCKNCEVMELTSFRNSEVKESLKSFHVVKFQAEDPSDPTVRQILDRFNVSGLPSYIVLEQVRR